MDLDSAADELYAVPPEEFTALRDQLVRRARDAGDKELAAQIKGRRRPTTVAWLANQLGRHHRADLGALLELGDELRQASAALTGADLRALSRQRSAVVQALVRQARTLARSLGRPVSETVARELEQTLLVALADPLLAERLEVGRLTERLDYAGFSGDLGASPPPATRSAKGDDGSAKPASAKPKLAGPALKKTALEKSAQPDHARRERERRQLELEVAWQAASTAKDAHDAARTAAEEADGLVQAAQQVVTDRRRAVEEAEHELSSAESAAEGAHDHENATAALLHAARSAVAERQHDLESGGA